MALSRSNGGTGCRVSSTLSPSPPILHADAPSLDDTSINKRRVPAWKLSQECRRGRAGARVPAWPFCRPSGSLGAHLPAPGVMWSGGNRKVSAAGRFESESNLRRKREPRTRETVQWCVCSVTRLKMAGTKEEARDRSSRSTGNACHRSKAPFRTTLAKRNNTNTPQTN